jgi:hypothetical protein
LIGRSNKASAHGPRTITTYIFDMREAYRRISCAISYQLEFRIAIRIVLRRLTRPISCRWSKLLDRREAVRPPKLANLPDRAECDPVFARRMPEKPVPAAAIRKKIGDEIAGGWSRSNLHGIDLRRSLLREPVLTTYKNSWFDPVKPQDGQNTPLVHLWLVLEENPITKKGYQIVYDQAADLFGLASGGIFISFYGNFIETFEAM